MLTHLPRRRPFLLAGGMIIILALGIAAAWYVWLPNYRPGLRPGEVYGIDVSAYQGHIDWRQVAGDHVRFAYIKATEGASFVDREFTINWPSARAAGLVRGAYHYFSLCSPGLAQAQNYLRTVPADPAALPPAVDLELSGNCHLRPSRTAVETQLNAFLHLVESATRRTALIYLGSDFAHRYPLTATTRRPLWLRSPLLPPRGGSWVIWQVDGNAHMNGIAGNVDLDVMQPRPLPHVAATSKMPSRAARALR